MNDGAECQVQLGDLVVRVPCPVPVLCLCPVRRIDLRLVALVIGFDYVPLGLVVVLGEEDQLEMLLLDGACWVADRNAVDGALDVQVDHQMMREACDLDLAPSYETRLVGVVSSMVIGWMTSKRLNWMDDAGLGVVAFRGGLRLVVRVGLDGDVVMTDWMGMCRGFVAKEDCCGDACVRKVESCCCCCCPDCPGSVLDVAKSPLGGRPLEMNICEFDRGTEGSCRRKTATSLGRLEVDTLDRATTSI